MLYLETREFGADKDAIAFPGVLGCCAIVLSTDYGLYGFHSAPEADIALDRYDVLAQWLQKTSLNYHKNSTLFGVVNTAHRGSEKGYLAPGRQSSARDELRYLANRINGKPRILYGVVDNSKRALEAIYIEFLKCYDPINGLETCKVSWKTMSKMQRKTRDTNNNKVIRRLNSKVVDNELVHKFEHAKSSQAGVYDMEQTSHGKLREVEFEIVSNTGSIQSRKQLYFRTLFGL